MTAGALHSDHINYLIFRYLQEHGHENAATAFHRDWHRPREYRNPEDFPFARVVERHELISVVQDGLFFDELRTRKLKNGRRFRWSGLNPREEVEEQDEDAIENGAAVSRPSSSTKRRGRPPVMRAPDEFPTPAPKRQRRSEGSEGVQLNGERDAADVDAASPSADADEEGEPASPEVASETEVMEVPERYDSTDVATQTAVKVGPKTDTMYWKVDKPGATILHSMWNPDSDPKNANTLLTVGESLCRFYHVPVSVEDAKQMKHVDDPNIPSKAIITASAWRADGCCAALAVDSMRELPDGRQVPQQLLLEHDVRFGSRVLSTGPSLLEPPGIILCLRYSPNGRYLLSVRTNIKRGLVQIWDAYRDLNGSVLTDQSEPEAWCILEHQVLDACWLTNEHFYLSGDQGLSSRLGVKRNPFSEHEFSATTIAMHGLIELDTRTVGAEARLDKVRFDSHHNLTTAAFASTDSRMIILKRQSEWDTGDHIGRIDLDGQLTALAFRPWPDRPPRQHEEAAEQGLSMLAVAFEEGFCNLYFVSGPAHSELLSMTQVTLDLEGEPALALAWSPQGTYLAVGSTDLVRIWDGDSLFKRNGMLHQPLVTWRPDVSILGSRNGERGDDRELFEPSLSWSADGESLAFAVDKQVAVIRFRPPLHADHQVYEERAKTNGATNH